MLLGHYYFFVNHKLWSVSMKTDNHTDHVSKKKGRISEIRWLAPKKTARKYPFKPTTRFQLSGAYAAAQSQQHCELLPKATDKYHQEGQKHDRLPGNLQLRKSGRSCCQCQGGEGLKCFKEPATGEGQAGGKAALLALTTQVHVAGKRRATVETYQNRRPNHFSSASKPVPSHPTWPASLYPPWLGLSHFPQPPAAAPSRPLRQGQPWHCPSPRPGSPSGHISRSRPAPHQSLDEWTRAGRAGRALGSAGAHPQWHRGKARLLRLPRHLRRRRRQPVTAAHSGTHRQRPPHTRRNEQPIGRGAAAPRTPIGCDCRLGSAPRGGARIDWQAGSGGRRGTRGWSSGRGLSWRAVPRCTNVKSKWPPQVRGAGDGCRVAAMKGAGNDGERAGEGEEAEVFQCLFLSVFTREAAWPAVKKKDGFLAGHHLSKRTQKQIVK